MTTRDQEALGLATAILLAWICVAGIGRCAAEHFEPAPIEVTR